MRLSRRVVDVRPDEVRALFLSWSYFFLILSSYYIIRPIRDEMGVAGGVNNLPWLFTGTLLGMLLANPLFATLVVKYPRKTFIPLTYRFFVGNLVVFFALLTLLSPSQQLWVGRAFYIWTAVFNLFVVSVFWAFMADVFRTDQAKRLFGFIGVGGTLGGLVGSAVTASLATRVGPVNLILVSAVLLELASQCVRRFSTLLEDDAPAIVGHRPDRSAERPIGGGVLAGISHIVRSAYMLNICAYMLLFTITSTFLYFQQAEIAASNFADRGARTAFFARIDVLVNVLTILIQAFLTGRLIKWLGVGVTLALLPALSVAGFFALAVTPTLSVFVALQVARRAGNFAVARPTREVLFTVVSREDKYKAKSFIDTFVYRGGDQIGAWSYALMGVLGLAMAGVSFVAVPMSAIWLGVALWLGREQTCMARDRGAVEPIGARAIPAVP